MVGGTILQKTTDGGGTYATITAPGTGNITGLAGAYSNFWYTRGNLIYYSSNAGTAWTTAFTGTNALLDIDVSTPNCCPVGWAVGAGGTILGMGLVGISGNNNEVPHEYNLMQNYPNPFNPVTNISFSIPKAGHVELKIYDVLGREAATIVNEFKQAGNYTVNFNASSFSSGVYFYTIKSGDFTGTKKMVLVK
jgi:hypothetical protein